MNPDIRTLTDDEKITEPGFYNISLARHHSQPCDGPSVTSGVLRRMELATPADVWAFSALNPDRWPQKDTPALRLGRAMAAYVEGGPDEVARHFRILPADAPRRPSERQIMAYDEGTATDAARISVEFWRDVELDHRDQISKAEMEMIDNMGRVLAADPIAAAMMDGEPEVTMAWKDEITGLWLLARPDTVSFDGTMSDYKKVNTAGRPFNYRLCDARITQHGYVQQMAFASYVFEKLTGEAPSSVGLVFQWDQAPHHVILRGITSEDLMFGRYLNRAMINQFRECLDSGHWPGPGDDIGDYQMPDWLREQLIDRMATEGYAE